MDLKDIENMLREWYNINEEAELIISIEKEKIKVVAHETRTKKH